MIVGDITELTLMAVLERGTPNKECIAIQVNESINAGQYGIMLGIYTGSKMAKPIQDNLFWFGDGFVESGDWIFIYTGEGEPIMSKTQDEQNHIYSLFWGKQATIFANTNIVPILFRIDAVDVLTPPENVAQIGR